MSNFNCRIKNQDVKARNDVKALCPKIFEKERKQESYRKNIKTEFFEGKRTEIVKKVITWSVSHRFNSPRT